MMARTENGALVVCRVPCTIITPALKHWWRTIVTDGAASAAREARLAALRSRVE